MNRFLRAAAAALIVLMTSAPAGAAAQTGDPIAQSAETAITLSRKLTGTLPANSSGSFAFYKFFYPGDGKTVSINAHFRPDDPLVLQHAGLKIYDIRGKLLVNGGRQPKHYPNMSGDVQNANLQEAGIYVIQLENYHPDVKFDFEIGASTCRRSRTRPRRRPGRRHRPPVYPRQPRPRRLRSPACRRQCRPPRQPSASPRQRRPSRCHRPQRRRGRQTTPRPIGHSNSSRSRS